MLQRKINQVKEKVKDEGGQERPHMEGDIRVNEVIEGERGCGMLTGVDSGQREGQTQKDQSMAGELEEEQGGQSSWSEGQGAERSKRRREKIAADGCLISELLL